MKRYWNRILRTQSVAASSECNPREHIQLLDLPKPLCEVGLLRRDPLAALTLTGFRSVWETCSACVLKLRRLREEGFVLEWSGNSRLNWKHGAY